jgi:hypothetical protein
LRGRHLEGAGLDLADLRKVDLSGAYLQRASLVRAQLQGASLDYAQLQGASLGYAQLQGASLRYAQLQGASLGYSQMQGASLVGAELQGASLAEAELQGASLVEAQLQGASLEKAQLQGAVAIEASVWRADARSANTPAAYLVSSNSKESFGCKEILFGHCSESPQSFEELRQFMIDTVPAGELRDKALERIEKSLKPEGFPDERAIADGWKEKEKNSAPPAAVLGAWKEIGCKGNDRDYNGAPFVARALIARLDWRPFENEAPAKAKLAAAFLAPSCAGAKGLTDEEIAKLKAEQGEPAKRASDGSTCAAVGGCPK